MSMQQMPAKADTPIGRILMKLGLVDENNVAQALFIQNQQRRMQGRVFKLGEILMFHGYISLAQLQGALTQQKDKLEAMRRSMIRIKEARDADAAAKAKSQAIDWGAVKWRR